MRDSLSKNVFFISIFFTAACSSINSAEPVTALPYQSAGQSAIPAVASAKAQQGANPVVTEGAVAEKTAEEKTAEYVQARSEEFGACVAQLQSRAIAENIPDWVVNDVIGQLSFVPRVIELDRSQPEFTRSFAQYFNGRVSEKRIETGRKKLAQHRDFLSELTRRYGVPGQYLVAFWGLETNFGSYLGNNSTLDSLATLGCDPRRSTYFTDELFQALRLITEGGIDPAKMRGSWAGAVGHTQFMPSNYRRYARDGDGDGKIDLWNSERDALASAAYFLQSLGWQTGQKWGREVRLQESFSYQLTGLKQAQPLHFWREMSVTDIHGASLPALDIDTAVLLPSGHRGPAFAVYPNFRVIMRWNRSEFFALSVGHLADRIGGGGALRVSPPEDAPRLGRELVISVQSHLAQQGFDPNGIDGVFGSGTKAAVKAFQRANALVPDGFLDHATLQAIVGSSQPFGE